MEYVTERDRTDAVTRSLFYPVISRSIQPRASAIKWSTLLRGIIVSRKPQKVSYTNAKNSRESSGGAVYTAWAMPTCQ